jgi:hypothetical protein
MATNRIVSKQELEDSGLSLRDFLNKERGLTRKPDANIKFGVNKARPSAQERAIMEAQDNANRGLDEEGQPLQLTTNYVPRDQYTSSGKATVDKQDEMARRDASMKNYTPRRDPFAADRTKEYKRGGSVKKMASGGSASSRADGIAQRGKTRGKFC